MNPDTIIAILSILGSFGALLTFIWRETKKSATESAKMSLTLVRIEQMLGDGEKRFLDHEHRLDSAHQQIRTHRDNLRKVNEHVGLPQLNGYLEE